MDYFVLKITVETDSKQKAIQAYGLLEQMLVELSRRFKATVIIQPLVAHIHQTRRIDARESDQNIIFLSIEKAGFNTRAQTCLKRAGIETIGQLLEKTDEDLLKLWFFGPVSLENVQQVLLGFGLQLKSS